VTSAWREVWKEFNSGSRAQRFNSHAFLLLLCLYSPLLGLGSFFSILILYTVRKTPWTGDRPVVRPLPTHRINAHTDIHALSEWDSSPRSQRSSERRRFMPQTARPLYPANHAFKNQINIFLTLLWIFQHLSFHYLFLQNPVSLISSIHATCAAHHNVKKLLHFPHALTLLEPHIFLTTMFSNIRN
jgi:hypothetical protein